MSLTCVHYKSGFLCYMITLSILLLSSLAIVQSFVKSAMQYRVRFLHVTYKAHFCLGSLHTNK